MSMKAYFIILLVLLAFPAAAQEEPAAEDFLKNPELPFTGTLAEDDPENDDGEEELFGKEPGEEEEIPTEGTHLIKFDFTGEVRFINQGQPGEPGTGEPYMEIEYNTQFEQVVNLVEARQTYKNEAEYEINNWGSLARNEFFDCRLDIDMQEMPVEITTRVNKTPPEEEGGEPIFALALKIDFSQDSREDWFSLCTDVSGATLNTQGEPEEYNLKVLRAIEPSLKGLVVDTFDRFDISKIDLTVPPAVIDDKEISNDISYSGKGSITVEPL
ncbi:MAG: hypothetical protein Q7S00_03240 [bacterium]|nr:hypothetical protein [bacterium]